MAASSALLRHAFQAAVNAGRCSRNTDDGAPQRTFGTRDALRTAARQRRIAET